MESPSRRGVADAVARFPEKFTVQAFPGRVLRISPQASYHNGTEVQLVVQVEDVDGSWSDFCRCTVEELRRGIRR